MKVSSIPLPYRWQCASCDSPRSLREDRCACGSNVVHAIVIERRRR